MSTIKEQNELFICACHSPEHQIIMNYWEYDNTDGEVCVSIHLCKERNIFKRIKTAIKYIFGYTSQYGDFDEFIFKNEDYEKLQKVVDFMKKGYERENK